jgi:hypothetical protein
LVTEPLSETDATLLDTGGAPLPYGAASLVDEPEGMMASEVIIGTSTINNINNGING